MRKTIVIFIVTFVLFFVESLIDYNIGATGGMSTIKFPNWIELIQLTLAIAIFSLLTAIISYMIIGHYNLC